jgi:hypothetical protein
LGVHFAALGLGYLEAGNDAGDLDLVLRLVVAAATELLRFGLHLAGCRGIDDFQIAQLLAILVERMAAHKEAKNILLVLQARVLVPVGRGRKSFIIGLGGWPIVVEHPEEAVLARSGVTSGLLRAFHRFVERSHYLRALAEGVQSSGLAERLEYTLVHQAEVDLFAELPERSETRLPCRL